MKFNNTTISLLFFLTSLFCSTAYTADIKAGAEKATACIGCHGQNGISSSPQWPNLAGQQPAYLSNQLKAFRDKTRKNPTMEGMAANLSDADIANLSAYFASLQPKSAGGDKTLATAGKEKFAMCQGCHGATAAGNGIFPRLAGQHPAYLAKQLKAFKEGSRKSGPMQSMAATLSPEDIKSITAYLGNLK
jgi:cytochrome c553